MPHMEAADEIAGLQFWNGDGTVQLLEAEPSVNALLLERCEPGLHLRGLEETEQDVIIASLLTRLWRKPEVKHRFRSLTQMLSYWSEEVRARPEGWPDRALVEAGLQLFESLPRTASADVLLHTDLHAGNVLRAHREPWLVIDPKPFVGDAAYDGTQHLLNCKERLLRATSETLTRFAGILGISRERLQAWTFARAAVEAGRRTPDQDSWVQLARALAL
jgi:streptomycin 6-kinase